ncbi:unnamed protein product [Ectocarpus fasciculatus]
MCRLSRRQASLYEEFMARSSTRAALQGGNFMGMMNILMQLRKVCNHPDLFEARQIDSPFVLPPLDLGVGTQVLRSRSPSSSSSWLSPCGFPARFGGVFFEGAATAAAAAAAAATGDGAATAGGKLDSGEDGGGEKARAGGGARRSPDGGVSRRLIAPLWAHDLRDGLPGLDVLSTELLSRRATPAEDVLKMPSKLPLCIPDPTQVDKSLNLMPQVLYRLTRLRKTLRGQARERRRLMAAISLNRCGLLPGGGGGGAGMEEAHPLNWRLVRTARLLYGHPTLEAAQAAREGDARVRFWCPLAMMASVKGLRERCEEMHPLVERFCFLVPKVMAWAPNVVGTPDLASSLTFATARERLRREVLRRGGLSLIYPAQIRQRICFPDRRLVQYDAGKLQVLAGLLRSRKQGGHKCLIFTQASFHPGGGRGGGGSWSGVTGFGI